VFGIYEEAEEIAATTREVKGLDGQTTLVNGYDFTVRNYGDMGMYWDGPTTTTRNGKRFFLAGTELPTWPGVSPDRTLKECVNRGYEECFEYEVLIEGETDDR
jgi:hypothetical protein